MNVCSGVLSLNFAKEVKRIKIIHYIYKIIVVFLAIGTRKHLLLW